MKSNIIPFRYPGQTVVEPTAGRRLRIECTGGFGLIDSLMFAWLLAWALVAGLECISAAGLIAI